MSISAVFGSRIVLPNNSTGLVTKAAPTSVGRRRDLVIECSSRPQKKGTAHHMKTRPKKTQPWDIKRRPTVYPPLPALPPDWSLLTADEPAATVLTSPTPQSIENP
ncbi:50S ribosomal protein 6, chloroplastic [Telopea speciosissima]|uniref:50S ribosomal protein 6, chloroplastic n=1 Tax=Telopea speciosissima TaxID=54955 RepID=UPI001CC346A1|nr:50S ribosomal protein 6, chloroplastic [Telopea speciosissima]